MSSLGDRIKRYEEVYDRPLVRRMPVIIRVDGRAFHTLTRGMEKPFDRNLMKTMMYAAVDTAREIQGFKFGYIQSDEVSFCITDYDELNTQGWFDYSVNKIVSISASLMSVYFNKYIGSSGCTAVFDSRAFNVPVDDVVNVFVWRAKDWERNSLQMYARSVFSHKQLHGKNREDMHEMLHQDGKNWATDLDERERNGTFIINTVDGLRIRSDIKPNYTEINNAVAELLETT